MAADRKIWGSAPAAVRLPRNIYAKVMQGGAYV